MGKTIKKNPKRRKDKTLHRRKRKENQYKKEINESRKKTLRKRKNQRGGIGGLAIVAGLTTLAVTALGAFAKYKHSELITERNKIDMILSQSVDLEYLPKYSVTMDKELIQRYLNCVTDSEFIEIIASNHEYLKSDTIDGLLKPYKDIDPELKELTEKVGLLTGYEDKSLQIDTIELSSSQDPLVKELSFFLLASSGMKDKKFTSAENKLAKSKINWIDIVFDGGANFDPELDNEVERILDSRDSSYFITDEIEKLLTSQKDNTYLIQAINKKMEDCTREPRSYWEFIKGDIKWNNVKKCLVCPDEDCLIYIYDYYYSFLKHKDEIPILKKIYILMLCEARICALSKCIILEALRQNGNNADKVRTLVAKIYERDKSKNLMSPVYPKK